MQPLIPPLFAPASQLLSDATLWASNDQPAVAAEHAIISNTPSIIAEGMSGRSDMEQPSEEVITPEKRTILPDLVPPDVPQKAISILSLRHLLYYQHLIHDRMESVTDLSESSTPAVTIGEYSSEDMPSTTFPQVNPIEEDVSSSSPIHRPPFNAFQPVQAQEAASPSAVPENTVIPPSLIHYDDWRQEGENLLNIASTKHESQHSQPEDHRAIPTEEASGHSARFIVDSSDVPAQPVLPQLFVRSELDINRDDMPVEARFIGPIANVPTMQQTTTGRQQPGTPSLPQDRIDQLLVEPLLDRFARSISRDEGGEERQRWPLWSSIISPTPSDAVQSIEARFIVPHAVVPAQNVLPTMMPHARQEAPNAAEDSQRRGRSATSRAGINSFTPTGDVSAIHPSTASDTPHEPHVSPMYQAALAQDEAEQPPIRITIGRVVVRATPAVQPRPTQKHVLRPPQSLGDYLKQREKGSR